MKSIESLITKSSDKEKQVKAKISGIINQSLYPSL
jgi:hypothetical protein